jgi:uncharacterized membrane protein
MKKLLSLMALFVVSLLSLSLVSAASGSIVSLTADNVDVEINDRDFDNGAEGRVVVEEGETLDLEVTINNPSANDMTDIEIIARLSGYEYSDYEDLDDSTHLFDIDAGDYEKVNLEVVVPSDYDNGVKTLWITIYDSNSNEKIELEYELKTKSARHSLGVDDVAFSPGNTIKAGRSLLTTVVVENFGDRTEEDIKVNVAIPELGVSATEYLDELEADEDEDVPEMFLPIPANAAEGDYEVKVTINYDRNEVVTESYMVHILANERFQVQDKLVLAIGPESQNVAAGKVATYAVALTNAGSTSKAYVLEAAAGDWASVSLSDSLVVLEAGKNKVVYVDAAVAKDAIAGEHVASLVVKSGGEELETILLTANVLESSEDNSMSLRNGLEIALIVLVVLLVIIGLIIGFSRLRKDDDEEEQAYY